MEERRLLLAVALSLLVLTAYSLLFPSAPPPAQPPAPVASQPAATPLPAEAAAPAAAGTLAPSASALPTLADERERRVEVTGPDFTVAFSNRGARLVSWTLARYKDARGGPGGVVPAAGAGIRPLDVETGVADVDARLREALFRASAETVAVAAGGAGALRFEWSDGQIEAEKSLEFAASGLLTLRVRVKQQGRELPARI